MLNSCALTVNTSCSLRVGLRILAGGETSAQPRRQHTGGRKLDHAEAADLRMGTDLAQRLLRRRVVEVEHRDGLAAGDLPADRHLGDVDVVLAEDRADEADQA